MYTYRDFRTGKIRKTNGEFVGWSKPTGPKTVPYAGFKRKKTVLWVPVYLLTKETFELLKDNL